MNNRLQVQKTLAAIVDSAGEGRWVVGGSAGLLLRGLPLAAQPRDVDLYCDEEDAYSIHRALREFATDEPVASETDIYRSTLSHYEINGLRVELVGGFQVSALGSLYKTEVKRLLIPFGDKIAAGNKSATIVPLAHELWFNALRGRADRVQLIAESFRDQQGRHIDALEAIESGNSLSLEAIAEVRRWLDNEEAGERPWTLK